MPTTTVQETYVHPGGGHPGDVVLEVYLADDDSGRPIEAAYTSDGDTIVGRHQVRLDENGFWELDLEANASIVPSGTAWAIVDPSTGGVPRYILVVSGDDITTLNVADILTDAPTSIAPTALAAHVATRGLGGHLPDDASDGDIPVWDEAEGVWVAAAPSGGGGGDVTTTELNAAIAATISLLRGGAAADSDTFSEVETTTDALATSLAGKQASDSDLTAIAALGTTSYGRAILELADAAAGRTALGLGSAAVQSTSAFDAAGAAAAAQAASQPSDGDLAAIAALATTSYGRGVLALADAAALRSTAGLVLGTDIYSKAAVDSLLDAIADLVPGVTTTLNTDTPGQVAVEQLAEEITQFTSGTNAYTAPAWATEVEVIITACGGPGGSGRCDVTNTIRGGGGGGGHGEVVRMVFPRSALSFPISAVVGAQGTVGASVSTTGTDGNPGVVGADSTITGSGLLFPYLRARAGRPGAAGTGAVGGAGGDNTIASMFIGMDGAKGGGDSVATVLTNAPGIGGGGGGGMGMTASGNTISAGSDGGLYPGSGVPGLAGISNAQGGSGSDGIHAAMGGGGGGRNTNGGAGAGGPAGGAGGFPGGGGGGGGAALFGQTGGSGPGGQGGGGQITFIARR